MKIKQALFWMASSRRLRALLLGLVAVFAIALGIVAYGTTTLATLEGNTINTRFSVRGHLATPKNIVLVTIDNKSLDSINQQYPWPRAIDGRLIESIIAQHPKAIAFDVQFTGKSPGSTAQSQNDEIALLNAVNDANGRIVFSTTQTARNATFLGVNGKKLLGEVGSGQASGLFPNGESASGAGGVFRTMTYSNGGLQTLAVAAVELATRRHLSRKQFGSGDQWINFVGPAGSFPSVSFSDAMGRRVPSHFFTGKIVVIGATTPVLQDIHATSTDSLMPGPEIHANAIYTILHGIPLRSAPGWVNIVLIVLLGLAVPLVSLRLGPIPATGIAIGLGVLLTIGVQLAFNSGRVVAFVYPLGTLILSGVGSLAVQLVTEAFERVRVRDLFSRFVPEDVVDEVLASADGLRLGGVQREGTVMFTDLRGFTSFAESLEPPQVIDVLNHYLSEMSDAILNHGGTLVAYMGDGIMAVFGAPLPQENHADRAVATAREMLDNRLPRFNEWLRTAGLTETGFRMGIGLNSGQVMSGHVGSERRVEYTAVGDTTNTASRIESLTKGTPHQLFLSGATKDALRVAVEDLVYVSETPIRGRVGMMELWSLADGGEPSETPPVSEPAPLAVSGPNP